MADVLFSRIYRVKDFLFLNRSAAYTSVKAVLLCAECVRSQKFANLCSLCLILYVSVRKIRPESLFLLFIVSVYPISAFIPTKAHFFGSYGFFAVRIILLCRLFRLCIMCSNHFTKFRFFRYCKSEVIFLIISRNAYHSSAYS